VLRYFVRAANAAGIGSADASTIGSLGTHSMEAYLPLLARCGGTPVGIQQKLMRHGDIRTTMNTYGQADINQMQEAHSKNWGWPW